MTTQLGVRPVAQQGEHTGPACPILGCDLVITNPTAFVCFRSWNALRSICCGKRRHSQAEATRVAAKRTYLIAYQCPACTTWHNGHPAEDADAIIAEVLLVKAYLIEQRGPGWFYELIDRWDPQAGIHTRPARNMESL